MLTEALNHLPRGHTVFGIANLKFKSTSACFQTREGPEKVKYNTVGVLETIYKRSLGKVFKGTAVSGRSDKAA